MHSIVIHAWSIYKCNNRYYLPYTHWIYLKEIANCYTNICLLSPTRLNKKSVDEGFLPIESIANIKVHELPDSSSYVASIKYFKSYYSAYKTLKACDTVYVRYPVPFGWLSKLFLERSKRIIHFVGDPIDAAKNNPNFSSVKKKLLTTFFMPEHLAYMWACKGASVFTNGHHIKEKLKKYGVNAKALISSTLNEDDFYFKEDRNIENGEVKLLYVGYLRRAKGVETVIKAFVNIKAKYPHATLTIVGTGEFEAQLQLIVQHFELTKSVFFRGHVDNRKELNSIFRSHHIFCFASLSEGSPRVVLEAMANGLNVVSTPVGALPTIFENGENILFSDFNDHEMLAERVEALLLDNNKMNYLRAKAYHLVKDFTIKSFIGKIFNES